MAGSVKRRQKPTYEACITGEVAEAGVLLRQAQGKAKGEAVQKIARLRGSA